MKVLELTDNIKEPRNLILEGLSFQRKKMYNLFSAPKAGLEVANSLGDPCAI